MQKKKDNRDGENRYFYRIVYLQNSTKNMMNEIL